MPGDLLRRLDLPLRQELQIPPQVAPVRRQGVGSKAAFNRHVLQVTGYGTAGSGGAEFVGGSGRRDGSHYLSGRRPRGRATRSAGSDARARAHPPDAAR